MSKPGDVILSTCSTETGKAWLRAMNLSTTVEKKSPPEEFLSDDGLPIRFHLKVEVLKELKATRMPVFMGTYYGEAVYAAIFSDDEIKYLIPEDDEDKA